MKNEHTFFIDCEECGTKMNENVPNEFLHKIIPDGLEHHLCKKCVETLGAVKVVSE